MKNLISLLFLSILSKTYSQTDFTTMTNIELKEWIVNNIHKLDYELNEKNEEHSLIISHSFSVEWNNYTLSIIEKIIGHEKGYSIIEYNQFNKQKVGSNTENAIVWLKWTFDFDKAVIKGGGLSKYEDINKQIKFNETAYWLKKDPKTKYRSSLALKLPSILDDYEPNIWEKDYISEDFNFSNEEVKSAFIILNSRFNGDYFDLDENKYLDRYLSPIGRFYSEILNGLNKTYYDKDWKELKISGYLNDYEIAKHTDAKFGRVSKKIDSNKYLVIDYYINDHLLYPQMVGYYNDPDFKIKDGLFQYYFELGVPYVESIKVFKENMKISDVGYFKGIPVSKRFKYPGGDENIEFLVFYSEMKRLTGSDIITANYLKPNNVEAFSVQFDPNTMEIKRRDKLINGKMIDFPQSSEIKVTLDKNFFIVVITEKESSYKYKIHYKTLEIFPVEE